MMKRIEKDFWKYCKEIFENQEKVLNSFDKTICYEHFIKALKKNKHERDYSPPSWIKILDEPTSLFDLSPRIYRAKLSTKMKSSGSTCPFDHVSVIALKRCPILRSSLHRIIVYCWQNNIIPKNRKRGFCVHIYKKGSPKQPSNFRSITLEPVCAYVTEGAHVSNMKPHV